MKLHLGETIRQLRQRDGRTQEDLALALGVSCQAVSRWENGGAYPDMETIPALANYFGISIDELFGYEGNREKKIDAILAQVEAYDIPHDGDDTWVEPCLAILREGLAEFPGNERLIITLAETLWEAGWRRHGTWRRYGEDGCILYCYDKEKKNPYWSETEKLCIQLMDNTRNAAVFARTVAILVPLCRNYGEYERALTFAERMPELNCCREYLRTEATDGKEEAKYIGAFLLRSAMECAEQIIFSLISDLRNFESDMPIQKVKGAIAQFDLICDDGNMGEYHRFVSLLWMYLSRLQGERGYYDDAFISLDKALQNAEAFSAIADGKTRTLTAPLVAGVEYTVPPTESARNAPAILPDDWPFWCNPDYHRVKAELEADPRWADWVRRCRNA